MDLADLARPGAADATYLPVPGLLVRYPAALVWPLALLGLLAVGAFGWQAVRTGAATVPRLPAGAGLALAPLVLGPLMASLLWTGLVALRPGYAEMLDPWTPGPFRLAVVALVVTVVLVWWVLARRWVGVAAATFGVLARVGLLGAALAALAPGGSYLGALPALAGGAAGAVALGTRRPAVATAVGTVGAAVAVLVLSPTVVLFFPALGLSGAVAPALLATLLGPLLLPAGPWPAGRAALWPATGAGVVAVALTVTGLVVDRFDSHHPLPTQLMYALDLDAGRARWLSQEADPGAWTSRFVTGRDQVDGYPVLEGELAAGPAPVAPLLAPTVTVESDTTTAVERTVTVRLRPQRDVRLVAFRVEGATVARATVAGRPIDPVRIADGPFGSTVHAPPQDGVPVILVLTGGTDVRLWVGDVSDGLADLPGFTPRPDGVGVAGSHLSELVLVSRTHPRP